MLTLPDSDSALQNIADGGSATQHLQLPTPWRNAASTTLKAVYQQSTTGLNATCDSGQGASHTLQLDAPVALNPITVGKPWGQEIWFSGIEPRGETTISQGEVTLPLADYLALAPDRLLRRAPPLLLKILDPRPEPVLGNLYFETHDSKFEVYVVTHVDTRAWPQGVGAIRLGMNQAKRAAAGSDNKFRDEFLNAVKHYESVRRELDKLAGTPPAALVKTEISARQAMEAFTAEVELRVGDVVQVAPGVPHSLRYGVRVFEFQTPVYERNIISFDQQVVTQDHWDSAYAIGCMSLDGPSAPELNSLHNETGIRVERIVDFSEFLVLRVWLAAGSSYTLDSKHPLPHMIAAVNGAPKINTLAGELELDQAATHPTAGLVPASATQIQVQSGAQDTTFLVATPKPHMAGTIPLTQTEQDNA